MRDVRDQQQRRLGDLAGFQLAFGHETQRQAAEGEGGVEFALAVAVGGPIPDGGGDTPEAGRTCGVGLSCSAVTSGARRLRSWATRPTASTAAG